MIRYAIVPADRLDAFRRTLGASGGALGYCADVGLRAARAYHEEIDPAGDARESALVDLEDFEVVS